MDQSAIGVKQKVETEVKALNAAEDEEEIIKSAMNEKVYELGKIDNL